MPPDAGILFFDLQFDTCCFDVHDHVRRNALQLRISKNYKTPLRFIVLHVTCFVNSRSARVFTNMTNMLLGCKRFHEKDSKITLMKIQIL